MFQFLLSVLYDVDLFKTPFLLRFKNRKKSSTYVGSFVSLLIFSTALVSLFQSDVLHKKSPKVVEKVVSTYSPSTPGGPSITIDRNFSYFPFAFGVADLNRNLVEDPTIFTMEVFYKVQVGSNWTEYPVYTRICTPEESVIKGFNFSRSHCLPSGETFIIQGSPQEEVFSTLVFALRICNSQTDNVTCQSAENISAYMLDKYFYVFYADHTYDVDNYEHPINDEYGFKKTRASTLQSTFVGKYFQKSIFQSDDNPILSKYEETIFFTKYGDEQDSQPLQGDQFMYMNAHNRYLITYYFGTTPSIRTVTRTYQKLQEALANVAGISNFLIFIGLILTGFQSRLNMFSKIMKILFVLQKKEMKSTKKERKNSRRTDTLFHKQTVENQNPITITTLFQIQSPRNDPQISVSPDNLGTKEGEELKKLSPKTCTPVMKKDIFIEMNFDSPLTQKNVPETQIKTVPTDANRQILLKNDEIITSKNVLNLSQNLTLNRLIDRHQKFNKFQKYCKRDQKYSLVCSYICIR